MVELFERTRSRRPAGRFFARVIAVGALAAASTMAGALGFPSVGFNATAQASESIPQPPRPAWESTAAGRIVVEFDGTFLDTQMLEVIKGLKVLAPAVFTRDYTVTQEDKRYCNLIQRELKIPLKACTQDIIQAVQTFSKQRGGGTVLRPGVVLKFPEFDAETFTIRKQFDASRPHERASLEKLRAERKDSALPIRCEEIIRRNDVNSPEKVRERAERQSASRSIAPAATRGITGSGGVQFDVANKPIETPKECAPLELRDGDDEAVYSITLEGLRWIILVRDAKFLPDAESAASKLSNTSRVVSVERALTYQRARIKRYSFAPGDYFNRRCKLHQALPTDRGEYVLALRSEPDPSLAPGVSCENNGDKSEVVIMDTPVARHPDLQNVFWDDGLSPPETTSAPTAGAPPDSCGVPGSYKRNEHHGTYLAGIIASKGDRAGFVGVAPDVLLRSRLWNDQVPESDFRDYLSRQSQDPDALRVFLFASSFKIRRKEEMTPEERKETLQGGQTLGYTDLFKTPRVRFRDGVNGGLNKLIKERKMLLVVSAGQADSLTATGDPLQVLSITSPQNLGDLENVIVVGACSTCSGPDMALWGPSNYARGGDQTVHVAAPGGSEIPGIISATEVDSTIGGTSAAAAYVAGIAARMQACYPSAYTGRAWKLKEWLMLTARANLPAEDLGKVAGGVVDPDLAMVNPRKSWLKQPEKPIREIDVQSWCGADDVELTNQANVRIGRVQLRSMRRLTRVAGNMLISKEVGEPSEEKPTAPLTTLGPGRPSGSPTRLLAAVKMRQGTSEWSPACALQLKDVQDLLVRVKRDETPIACEQLPRCGG